METISISRLKARLSGELKKVQKGTRIVVLDHNHPVAQLLPLQEEQPLFVREAAAPYDCPALSPLTDRDPAAVLAEERSDRW
jgi:prevent-host-death family protein